MPALAQDCDENPNAVHVPVKEDTGDPGPQDECQLDQVVVPPGDAFEWQTTPPPDQTEPYDVNTWSCCWDSLVHSYEGESYAPISHDQTWNSGADGILFPTGFRFNFNLLAGSPSIGDFLDPSPTLGGSAAALLPPGGGGLPTGWQGVGRPTLESVADLITGLPLVQVTDLELPFGGAAFRLTRTRSGFHEWREYGNPYGGYGGGGSLYGGGGQDEWWDWGGAGWMISENPLLLVDAAQPDLVGPNPRVTWLVLDAFHAIPFQQVNLAPDGNGPRIGYEAPPRFRARMRHNGVWKIIIGPDGNETYGWKTAPTQYEVWLYDGLLKYTFVVARPPIVGNPEAGYVPPFGDDVPLKKWDQNLGVGLPDWMITSFHDTPYYDPDFSPDPYSSATSPGFGIPFYGLCTQIEDRHGNLVEISYCQGTRDGEIDDDEETEDCLECRQHCLRKGMIRHVRLITAAGTEEEEVAWTLMYAYRIFTGEHAFGFGDYDDEELWPHTLPADQEVPAFLGSAAIDRIYVYKGDVLDGLEEADAACMVIPSTDDPYGGDPIDPLEAFNDAATEDLPTDWVYVVRSWYRTAEWSPGGALEAIPMLVRTTVTSRDQEPDDGPGIPGTERVSETFYRYSNNVDMMLVEEESFLPFLERVYTNDDYTRLRAWAMDPGEDADADDLSTAAAILDWDARAFSMADYSSVSGELEGTLAKPERVKAFASIRMEPNSGSDWPDSSTSWAPDADNILTGGFVRSTMAEKLAADTSRQTADYLSIRGADEAQRHYRLHRLVVLPGEGTLYGDPFHLGGIPDFNMWYPFRSIFSHPYRWSPVGGEGAPTGAAELIEARWINVIDEFASREEMTSSDLYTGDLSVKPGQLSRRVVEINPAGHILRDKKWEFRNGEVFVSGGGLGEQWVYDSIENVFAAQSVDVFEDLAALVRSDDPDEENDELDPVEDAEEIEKQVGGFLNDLLLVEHRSVGWSAAVIEENAEEDELTMAGRIDRMHYHWFDLTETPDEDIPWRTRVQLEATSVVKGSDGENDPLYTRQYMRDPDHPADVTTEIVFLNEALADELFEAEPAQDLDPQSYSISRWVTVREESIFQPDLPETEWPIERQIAVGPPRQLRPSDEPEWYYPVAAQFMDVDRGLLEWTAAGLVVYPDNPAAGEGEFDSLVMTFSEYDGKGRLFYTVADASGADEVDCAYGTLFQDLPVGDWPTGGWSRLPAEGGLDYVTVYMHDKYGPTDIFMPNGRRWARRTVDIHHYGEDPEENFPAEPTEVVGEWDPLDPEADEPFLREYIFNDLEKVGDLLVARSPGEVRDYNGLDRVTHLVEEQGAIVQRGGIRNVRKVEFTMASGEDEVEAAFDTTNYSNFLQNPSQIGQPYFRELVKVAMRPDQYGRMTDADLFEKNSDGVPAPVGMQQINDLGEVFRSRDMDGTITRVTKNSLGQALRRYVGSIDDLWLDPETPADEIVLGAENDLVLVERTEYGLSANDAWMPTVTRRYVHNEFSWRNAPYGDPPPEDPDGQATVTSYDWRMRPVRVDVYSTGDLDPEAEEPATRLTTTLTFLDHGGRTRLAVSYGPGTLPTLSSDLNPSEREPGGALPTAGDFLQLAGMAPLSITETIYGAGGEVTETREYDVTDDGEGAVPYLASYQYTGMGGQVVFRQSPGAGATVTELDGLARPVQTKTVVPQEGVEELEHEFEVARTDYVYDDLDGNQVEVKRWERIVDAMSASPTDPELDYDNAVVMRTFHWYDHQKRLIATAEAGTSETKFISDGAEAPLGWTYDPQDPPTITDIDAGTIDTGCLDSVAIPLTIYHYDRRGNIDCEARRTGASTYIFTRTTYTGTGKVAHRVEDFVGAEPRETIYEYRFGRLSNIHAVTDGEPFEEPEAAQVSQADFGLGLGGAEVVDSSFETASHSGAHVFGLRLPDPDTGEVNEDPGISLKYDFAGRLAERTDARGITVRYSYDDLDRLSTLEVGWYDGGSWTAGYPPTVLYAEELEPASRIGYIEYDYDDDMRSYTATAKSKESSGELISQVTQEYDARGNLSKDWQSFGEEVAAGTPNTEYEWNTDFTDPAAAPGHTRLSGMNYPRYSTGNTQRTVDFDYGTAEAMPDALGLWRDVQTTKSPLQRQAAKFGWIGSGRRCWRTMAQQTTSTNGGSQTFLLDEVLELTNGKIGLLGLDTWGRVTGLSYHTGQPSSTGSGGGTTITGITYTYDLAGRRTNVSRTKPDPWTAQAEASEKHINTYDGLNRLTHFKATNINGATIRIEQDWTMDLLGNWTERETTTPTPVTDVRHFTDERNRIQSIETEISGQSPTSVELIYDAAGNLAYDGTYAYQYDAWNRLVSVHIAGLVGSPHDPPIAEDITLTYLVKHHTYDALGRLARTLSPYPSPTGQQDGELRSERFYYDGIRRLVEVNIDLIQSLDGAVAEGGALQALAEDALALSDGDIDPSQAPAAYEVAYIDEESPTVTTAREYVWGPGDRGIYELLCQFNSAGTPIWIMQDEGGDVIAACDNLATGDKARNVGLWAYGPYGEVTVAQNLQSHSPIHAGHKGLFTDRLDGGIVSGGSEVARLVAGSNVVPAVFANNRHLLPKYGRWAQMDPNASGLNTMGWASGGQGMGSSIDALNLDILYSDEAGLYQYVRSNPWMRDDPLGTWSYLEMAQVGGVSGLISGLISATMEKIFNPDASAWDVMLAGGRGFAAGAVGGGVGYFASAYAASASGLYASLWARGAIGGVSGGGAGGFTDGLLARKPWQELIADSLFSAALGGVLGASGGKLISYFQGVGAEFGPFSASGIRRVFDRVVLRDSSYAGYVTRSGEVGFVKLSPSMQGHAPAMAAGKIPEGSLGFSFSTNAARRVRPGSLNFQSALNLGLDPSEGRLPEPVARIIRQALGE